MKKVVFEGTEEQIKNLLLLLEFGSNDLPKLRDDFQTENMWQLADVQLQYDCTEEEAMKVLEQALANNATMDQIWFAIRFHAEDMKLKKKKEE